MDTKKLWINKLTHLQMFEFSRLMTIELSSQFNQFLIFFCEGKGGYEATNMFVSRLNVYKGMISYRAQRPINFSGPLIYKFHSINFGTFLE